MRFPLAEDIGPEDQERYLDALAVCASALPRTPMADSAQSISLWPSANAPLTWALVYEARSD